MTDVNLFHFNDEILAALETSLSPERIETYIQATNGDKEQALRLYTWNTAVSAAFYGPLQGLEVALRNAMHRQLDLKYGSDWYDNSKCGLDAGALNRIDEAKHKLKIGRYRIDPPHIIAELPFGFWVSLLGKGGRPRQPETAKRNYDMTLWRPALYKAFPNSKRSRSDTHNPLDYLRTLRNRIAHHEPIFTRHLRKDYQSIIEVTEWICPKTAEWIRHHSRVESLLNQDRHDNRIKF
ncbi:MAG: Abi family protein [Methylomonas sp.]|nr:Abi family protein [Methylomonas sp.]